MAGLYVPAVSYFKIAYTMVYTMVYAMVYAKINCYNFYMAKIIRKLQRTSRYSYCIILPKEIINKYGWKEGQKITVKDKGRGVIEIKDWRKK